MELRIDQAAEQGILTALRAGQVRQAARLMVQYHGVAVFDVCVETVGDPEAAEDLTQATFARAFALLHGFRGELTSREWLLGIALQSCEAASAGTDSDRRATDRTISDSLRRRLEVLASAV